MTDVNNLDVEIGMRKELAYDLMNKGHKFYLLIRNLGTVSVILILGLLMFGYSHIMSTFVLCGVIMSIWLYDYIDFSGRALGELECIIMLESHVPNTDMSSVTRRNCVMFSPEDIKTRTDMLQKKKHD
jgi:hypothetical protein